MLYTLTHNQVPLKRKREKKEKEHHGIKVPFWKLSGEISPIFDETSGLEELDDKVCARVVSLLLVMLAVRLLEVDPDVMAAWAGRRWMVSRYGLGK